MIPALWNGTIFGGIAMATEDFIVTAPRLGDGNWRGGLWAKYDRQTGACKWQRKHRRGAQLFDRIGDIVFATTHKFSGVYAFSLESGQRLWARLGDRFDLLLQCFDWLPCDNEGDGPERVWNGGLLTRSGRLLDPRTGKIASRHQLEFSSGSPRKLAEIDGNKVSSVGSLRARESIDLYKQDTEAITSLLLQNGLGLAGIYPCAVTANDLCVSLACKPPHGYRHAPESRFQVGGSNEEVPHYLIVSDASCSTVLRQFELGTFFAGELDWVDDSILSVTTQTRRQWKWSYQRQMWLIEWGTLREILATD